MPLYLYVHCLRSKNLPHFTFPQTDCGKRQGVKFCHLLNEQKVSPKNDDFLRFKHNSSKQ